MLLYYNYGLTSKTASVESGGSRQKFQEVVQAVLSLRACASTHTIAFPVCKTDKIFYRDFDKSLHRSPGFWNEAVPSSAATILHLISRSWPPLDPGRNFDHKIPSDCAI